MGKDQHHFRPSGSRLSPAAQQWEEFTHYTGRTSNTHELHIGSLLCSHAEAWAAMTSNEMLLGLSFTRPPDL